MMKGKEEGEKERVEKIQTLEKAGQAGPHKSLERNLRDPQRGTDWILKENLETLEILKVRGGVGPANTIL